MIQAVDNTLSEGLIGLLEAFEPHLGSDIEITSDNVAIIVRSVRVMRKLALNMEREVAVLQMAEDSGAARSFLGQESVLLLKDGLKEPDADAKVISPDFWRKS